MIFFGFLIGVLVFFLRKSFEDAVELATTRSKGGNNVLGGRLEKSDNVGDEFVFALDGSESVDLIGTEINCFFYISALECGEGVAFLDKVLEEFGGGVTHVRAHQGA